MEEKKIKSFHFDDIENLNLNDLLEQVEKRKLRSKRANKKGIT